MEVVEPPHDRLELRAERCLGLSECSVLLLEFGRLSLRLSAQRLMFLEPLLRHLQLPLTGLALLCQLLFLGLVGFRELLEFTSKVLVLLHDVLLLLLEVSAAPLEFRLRRPRTRVLAAEA